MTNTLCQLYRRIDALERDAAALRLRFLNTPLDIQEETGVWAKHHLVGKTALGLFHDIKQQSKTASEQGMAEWGRAVGRIEAAYQLVHEAIGSLAALVLTDSPIRH